MVLAAVPYPPVPPPASDGFADRVLAELNRAREHPRELADELRRYGAGFRGRDAYGDDPDHGQPTLEGAAAAEEAAAFLDAAAPLGALTPSPLLRRSARFHADEQAETGAVGHASADGRGPGDRAVAAGGDRYVAEAIAYGFGTPERAVRQLLVDDGVARRGHRLLLFSARLRYAGVACAPHPEWREACVIDVAETPDGSPALPPRGP